jgi:hypothetical protein
MKNVSREFRQSNCRDYASFMESSSAVFVMRVDSHQMFFQEAANRAITESNVIPLMFCTLRRIRQEADDCALLTILGVMVQSNDAHLNPA